VIDTARAAGGLRNRCGVLPSFDPDAFRFAYNQLDQPEFHPLPPTTRITRLLLPGIGQRAVRPLAGDRCALEAVGYFQQFIEGYMPEK
jgi:hypothetical protein